MMLPERVLRKGWVRRRIRRFLTADPLIGMYVVHYPNIGVLTARVNREFYLTRWVNMHFYRKTGKIMEQEFLRPVSTNDDILRLFHRRFTDALDEWGPQWEARRHNANKPEWQPPVPMREDSLA